MVLISPGKLAIVASTAPRRLHNALALCKYSMCGAGEKRERLRLDKSRAVNN